MFDLSPGLKPGSLFSQWVLLGNASDRKTSADPAAPLTGSPPPDAKRDQRDTEGQPVEEDERERVRIYPAPGSCCHEQSEEHREHTTKAHYERGTSLPPHRDSHRHLKDTGEDRPRCDHVQVKVRNLQNRPEEGEEASKHPKHPLDQQRPHAAYRTPYARNQREDAVHQGVGPEEDDEHEGGLNPEGPGEERRQPEENGHYPSEEKSPPVGRQ